MYLTVVRYSIRAQQEEWHKIAEVLRSSADGELFVEVIINEGEGKLGN